MRATGLGLVLLVLALAAPVASETDLNKMQSGVAESKKNLGAIKRKIQEEKKRVREIDRKESSVIAQLNRLDQNLAQKEKERKALDQKLKAVIRKVEKASEDLGVLNQNISAHEKNLMERLVALYKFSDWELPEMIFSSQSYEDLKTHQRFLAMILDQDRQLIEDFRKREERVRNHRQQLQADEKELQELKKKTEKKKEEIQRDRAKKEQLLRSVREEKKVHLAAIQELETASVQLQALIDKLERQIRAKEKERLAAFSGKGFAAARGKLPFPVQGRILSTFGKNENPKFNTFTLQKGIEIEAPQGAEIRAIYPGRILYADWFKGYGKILIIDHGEGYYTISGHASALLRQVGEEVRAGETVALVGDTGSLRGPCLYFEIRHRGKPLDPLDWLAPASTQDSGGKEKRAERSQR